MQMQIAALNYGSRSTENFSRHSQPKLQHRHILFTKNQSSLNKSKQQRSYRYDVNTNSNGSLPPIKSTNKRPSSIRIKGDGLSSSKLTETSTSSFRQLSRTKSDGTPSRSVGTPSKPIRQKFGYPVKFRSSDLNDSELISREKAFVSDSIRTANEGSRSSIMSHYEPLDDPNLEQFFQSSIVSDVVRKTLNIDLDQWASMKNKKRSKRNDRNDDYLRIVAKRSSGYSKLNGYDCIPPYAPARLHRSLATSSLTSFSTTYSSSSYQQRMKSKQLAPIVTSFPLRHPTTVPASSVSQD